MNFDFNAAPPPRHLTTASHPHTTCAQCRMSPIVGWRLHCVDCSSNGGSQDVDFCEHCFRYRSEGHDAHHTVTVLREPRIFGVPSARELNAERKFGSWDPFAAVNSSSAATSGPGFHWGSPAPNNNSGHNFLLLPLNNNNKQTSEMAVDSSTAYSGGGGQPFSFA
jgi:hypothetical protein